MTATTIRLVGIWPVDIRALGKIEQLWPVAVLIRVVAVVVLLSGPWTDEPSELSGWDVERFQEIAERTDSAWVDEPIEYPPGSVLIFDTVAGSTVVETNRRLVLLAAASELAATVALWRRLGQRAAKGFLLLGLPLVPMGLLRLDLVVTAVATVAALLLADQPGDQQERPAFAGPCRQPATLLFGVLLTIGAMIKIWPGLLIAAAVGRRNLAASFAAAAICGVAGVGWLLLVGNGIEPIDQVLSLRGASGWHVESLPGSLVRLLGAEQPRLELNAFRIGALSDTVVIVGRIFAVGVIGTLAATAYRRGISSGGAEPIALVMLGSTATLMVTAPLLSPQFLLWLTPWGAMLLVDRGEPITGAVARILVTLSAALILTGLALTVFGPPNLARTIPALLLTIRNGCLIALPVLCLRSLLETQKQADQTSVAVE